ncbi:MAG: hypothetical protein MJ179_02495 [Treponema sp.]|nr:hypothetical protein [Treponema sp.]
MKISVCCPSYKRPKVETLDYLPFCKVYVDPSEYEAYIAKNPAENIVKCDEGIQGNLCRVRNYILDKEFEAGADVVLIVDDDLHHIGRFVAGEDIRVETEDFLPFIEKYSIMAMDLGAYFWGVNINADYKCYREYTPFSTVAYIGGPFQCFIKDGGLRYDERLPLKEDYDMSIQQCRKYRKVLRVNAYHYFCKQSKQKGGCATYRNSEKEVEQLKALRRKWGGAIVKSDVFSNKRKRKVIDYNPIIHIPIKGV